MPDLKKCPFCGSKAEYLETSDPIPLCFVKCTGENGPCYCQTIVVTKVMDWDPKEDLIRIWNMRVGEDA